MENLEILRGKTVLVTGHTGFCGAWMCLYLLKLGAKVVGYSLDRYNNTVLFDELNLSKDIIDNRGDIRDYNYLKHIISETRPSLIFHLAAQPLVRKSYDQPLETFSTNILGTMNILNIMNEVSFIKACVVVTTDKVYKPKDEECFEGDILKGHDPYSTSKVCAEHIVDSYRDSFFSLSSHKLVATARAGNIIGSGDYSEDRLIPDCIYSLEEKDVIKVRNPSSVRPWQHVTDVVRGYLMLGSMLLDGNPKFATAWNFAPDKNSSITVSDVVELTINHWGDGSWMNIGKPTIKHEANILLLSNKNTKKMLGWKPRHDIDDAIKLTVEGYKDTSNILKQVEEDLSCKN